MVMMVSDVPQIDLRSLSRQQLQHLLETSRRTGRTSMADAVAYEMRERRAAHPEAPRSWVEVDFKELASESEFEFAPELEFAPAPQPEPEPESAAAPIIAEAPAVAPRQDMAPATPADPYAFSALRSVPDTGPPASEPAPRRTRTLRPRAGAPAARSRSRRAGGPLLAAVALGAAAVAAVAAIVPLQRFQVAPPPASAPAPPPPVQAALTPPDVPGDQPLPRAAVALTLRGPITSPAEPAVAAPRAAPSPSLSPGPSPSPSPTPSREFVIAAADLKAAAEHANQADMAKAHPDGLQGTWISPDFAPARCRWSRTDPALAVCQTRTRYEASRPWRERTGHYRRAADGAWQVAP